MKRINVLHLKTSANISGAELILFYLFKYSDRDKFRLSVIFAEDGSLLDMIKDLGHEVLCFKTLKYPFGFIQLFSLAKYIKLNEIDLIHAHGGRVNFWGAFASLLTGVPIISTEQNIDLWRERNWFFNLLDSFAARINRARVGVAPSVCKMLIKRGVKNVTCINNAIEVERFGIRADKDNVLSKFSCRSRGKIIGTVGRLVEQKGHEYFLNAAKAVIDRFPDTLFFIVGNGPLMNNLVSQAKAIGIADKVIFTGKVNNIQELISVFDVFVLPSITEGLPLALLEAMAAEKPIVATRVGGIPDVVEDGIDGLLVEKCDIRGLADKICLLLSDAPLAFNIASNARKKVVRLYDAKDMVNKYQEMYLTLIKGEAI